MNDIAKILTSLIAKCLYSNAGDMVGDDLEILHDYHEVAITECIALIEVLFEQYNAEKTGVLITKIRESDGIDSDAIDQILGVQPEDI